jgi:hypothetical protein
LSSGIDVNGLVNACMNKLRRMRWPPRGAQRVLQAGAAAIDGPLRTNTISLAA